MTMKEYNIVCVVSGICGCGETGRHARFRFWCREVCRFKSCHPHYKNRLLTSDFFWCEQFLFGILLAKRKSEELRILFRRDLEYSDKEITVERITIVRCSTAIDIFKNYSTVSADSLVPSVTVFWGDEILIYVIV